MELKSLILGLVFTIGVFAVKSGVGLHYFLNQRPSMKDKLIFFPAFGVVYFAIFILSSMILHTADIVRYFDIVQNFAASGMVIHILMATLLMIWGFFLLRKPREEQIRTLGWLVLIIPCPVCMTVIFFSAGFLVAVFPDSGHWPAVWACKGFLLINFLTVILLRVWTRKTHATPETMLGSLMMLIAGYFFLSVVLMPQFGELDKIYRLATCNSEKDIFDLMQRFRFWTGAVIVFGAGFMIKYRKIRRINHWTSVHC